MQERFEEEDAVKRLVGAGLGDIYDLSQFSVSRWHVKPLAESAAVVELIHRLR